MVFKPEKYSQLMVYLTVRQCEAAIQFYTQAFQFKLIDSVPGDDGQIQHVELKYGDAVIMMGPEGARGDGAHKAPINLGTAPSSSFYLYVDNVDSFYQNAVEFGATSVLPPEDSFWGDRTCRMTDPEGYEWMFATYLGK